MIDLDTIKANYANMLDTQLVNIAKEDGHELQPEALAILKEEFIKRNLPSSYINDIYERKSSMYDEQIKKAKESTNSDFSKMIWEYMIDERESGTNDEDILLGLQERGLDEENSRSMLMNFKPKLKAIIDGYDAKMMINVIVLITGSAITVLTYNAATLNGGTYYITWGAILFGAIGFIVSASTKEKYKRILNTPQKPPLPKIIIPEGHTNDE
jgi:hypothetical protein